MAINKIYTISSCISECIIWNVGSLLITSGSTCMLKIYL